MKLIFIKTQKEGLHRFPAASGEQEYLANLHRHMFGVCLKIQVYHDDRELEFIAVKQKVNQWMDEIFAADTEHTISCEQIAAELIKRTKTEYGSPRIIIAEVNEDNENGAIVRE